MKPTEPKTDLQVLLETLVSYESSLLDEVTVEESDEITLERLKYRILFLEYYIGAYFNKYPENLIRPGEFMSEKK